MAQYHADNKKVSNRGKNKNNKKNKGNSNKKGSRLAVILIWGIVLAVAAGVIIFAVSGFHNRIKDKIKTSQYPQSYKEYVDKAAKDYDLDPALIYAVIRTESGFNANAESHAGAYGLMQITDDTFEHYMNLRGESGNYTVEDLFTPSVNIDYGCNILSDHINTFGDEECAVAAYNAGPGNVEAWLSDPVISPDGKTLIVENIPFDETRNYVERVEESKKVYKELYY